MPGFQFFHHFIFTNGLLPSSCELMLTKLNWGMLLIYHKITGMICLGSNSIRIFSDLEVLSHGLTTLAFIITSNYIVLQLIHGYAWILIMVVCKCVIIINSILILNRARAGLRLARAWFLKIDPVRIVCMRACVCPRPRLLITSGVI